MFLGLIPFEQLAYEVTVGCCANLTYLYLLTLLIDLRFKRAFWTSELLVNVVLLPFRIVMPDALRVVIMLTVFMFIPVGMSRGNLLYRIGMSVAIFIMSFVGELAMSYVFMALTGQFYAQPAVSEHLPAAFLGMLVMAGIGIVLTLALRATVRKFGIGRKTYSSARSLAPMLVALLQPLLFLVTMGSMLLPLSQRGAVVSIALCVVCVLEIISVVLLYASSEQYAAKRAADLRAEVLEQGMQMQLGKYAAVAESIEQVARLRHDLRNQVQVTQILLAQGETARARDIVCDMVALAKGRP